MNCLNKRGVSRGVNPRVMVVGMGMVMGINK